jgi:hypothetical protein
VASDVRTAYDPIETPAIGDALQLMTAGVLEGETGSGNEILHGSRHEYLRRGGQSADTSPDVHGYAANLPRDRFALSGVEPGSYLEAKPGNGILERLDTSDRSCGPVKGGEEPVTCRVHLGPSVTGEEAANGRVMFLEEVFPGAVAELSSLLGGTDDVGEEHGGEYPVQGRFLRSNALDEALDLVQDAVLIAQVRHVVLAGQATYSAPAMCSAM